MLGIVFTTPNDASHFLDQHMPARIDRVEEGTPVQIDNLLLTVTGQGKVNAAIATERLLHAHDVDTLVHTGTCTAMSEEYPVGSVVGASFVLEGDRVELEAPTYPRMPLECPYDTDVEGTLVSQDHSPDPDEGLNYWARLADVRDSTGYAVAYVAAQHGISCHIAKAVDSTWGDEPEASSTTTPAIASLLESVVETTNPRTE